MVDVICGVVANPSEVTFFWTFNNSADFINVPRARALTINATTSKLTYTPRYTFLRQALVKFQLLRSQIVFLSDWCY